MGTASVNIQSYEDHRNAKGKHQFTGHVCVHNIYTNRKSSGCVADKGNINWNIRCKMIALQT